MGLLGRLNRSGNEVLSPDVDWAAAANEPSRSPGRLDEPPPDGGAATLLAP